MSPELIKILIEVVGYTGTILVVVSFMMSSVVKLRVVNTIGCVFALSYALINHTFPIAAMNIALLIINIYYLRKLTVTETSYKLLEAGKEDAFLGFFLENYHEDIMKCYPGADFSHYERAFIICENTSPVGVILARGTDELLDVILDYSTPQYRDCSVGKFVYPMLREKGVGKFRYVGVCNEDNRDYLKKVGYAKKDDELIL